MRIFRCSLLLFPFFALAQNEPSFNVVLIPPGLTENADAVVRLQEITFNVSAPDEAVLRERRIVTLFSDTTSYNVLFLQYSSFNKIGKIRGSLYDAAGNFIRDVEKKEIIDHSIIAGGTLYSDNRVRYLSVSHNRFPYTIVFEYEIKYRDLLYYDNWDIQKFNTAVEKASYSITMPDEIKLYYKSLNINLEPTITPDKGKRNYQWKVENLPAIKQEPYAPSAYGILPTVLLSPGVFKADGYTGSMASWKAFGQFQYDLSKGRDELSPALKNRVHALTAEAKTDEEKIAILYRYMQENTRYVSVQLGIGGWQPFDALYVENNKYGDCKALSNFMKALLREVGITSYPAIVKAGEDFPDLSDDFASSAFNHMILYVPSPETWLECTSNNFPPGYLGNFTADRKVLLVIEQGGKIVRTPAYSPAESAVLRRTEINVTASGGATISKQSTLYGPAHEWYRNAANNLTPDELKKEMQKKCPLPQVYFTSLSILPDKDHPSVRVEYAMDVPQLGSKAGKRLFLPMNPLNAYNSIPPANNNRIHPVEIRQGYVEQDTILFHLPEAYVVESIPAENTTLTTEFGSYASQLVRNDAEGTLLLVRRLEMQPVHAPANRYTEWRNFLRDVARADAGKVVLIQKP